MLIKRLDRVLKERNIPLNKLATYTNLSLSLISRIISEERNITNLNLLKICDYLKINPDYILGTSETIELTQNLKQEISKLEENANIPVWATRLQIAMEEKDLKQSDLSKSLSLSKPTISKYVNGHNEPSYETLMQIADYLDVSVDYLLGRTIIKNNAEILKSNNLVEKVLKIFNDHGIKNEDLILDLLKKTCEIYIIK